MSQNCRMKCVVTVCAILKSRISILAVMALFASLTANAQFNNPNGLAFDSEGNLWLANAGANQVLELNPTTGAVLNTITQGLDDPVRLFFNASGDLWVLNLNGNNVTEYDDLTKAGGNLVATVTNASISRPLALAIDAYGDFFIGDNSANSVIALRIDSSLVETLTKDDSGFHFTAPGVLAIHGENIYAGFGPNVGENAVISYNVGEFLTDDPKEITVYNDNVNTGPTGVAFDSKGNVYISEYTSGTAVKYAANNGTKPLLVNNQGTGGCEGIAVVAVENSGDAVGDIYVSNSIFNNITVYNSSGTLINTLD